MHVRVELKAAFLFAGDARRVPRTLALDRPDTNDLAGVALQHDERAVRQMLRSGVRINCITLGDEGCARRHVLRRKGTGNECLKLIAHGLTYTFGTARIDRTRSVDVSRRPF